MTTPTATGHRCDRIGCQDPDDRHDCVTEGCPPRADSEGPWHFRARPTPRTFCDPCVTATIRALADLPELYVALYLELEPGSSVGERISGSRSAPLPLAADVEALMQDTITLLIETEDDLRRHLGWSENPARATRHAAGSGRLGQSRGGFALTSSVQFLTRHIDAVLTQPRGATVGNQLIRQPAKIRRALGDTRGDKRRPEPCPQCDRKALYAPGGEWTIRCGYCSTSWDRTDYESKYALLIYAHQATA